MRTISHMVMPWAADRWPSKRLLQAHLLDDDLLHRAVGHAHLARERLSKAARPELAPERDVVLQKEPSQARLFL